MRQFLINRRGFLKVGAAGFLGMLGAANSSFPRETQETLRIGYLPITDATPLLIAHARGYFKDEGLVVEKPILVRSWSTLLESFVTGKFNVTHLLIPIPIWMRFNNRIPVKIVAWDHTNGSAITVSGSSGIRGFADLGGKQIAVPFWYSMHNIILQMGLRTAGLKPVIKDQSAPLAPDEVNLFILPPPDMPAALAARKIDGYIVAEPFNAIGEMKIGAKIMRFSGDIWKNHPCCVVVMHEGLIEARPVFTQKVVNALVKAQLWTSGNRVEAAKILSREGGKYLPVPEEILVRVFTGYESSKYGENAVPRAIRHPDWEVSRIDFQPYPYPSATRLIVDQMRCTVMEGDSAFLENLDSALAARDLVDDRYVKNAIHEVGGISRFHPLDFERPWEREEVVAL
jgi:NitT/TauT family transport system substrate-binding protein